MADSVKAITIDTSLQSGIRLSHSPIIFGLTVNATEDGGTYTDLRQAAVITMYHVTVNADSSETLDLLSSVEVPADNQKFTIDVSSAVRGWFICRNYDCSSLSKLKADIKEETFAMKIWYKCKRVDNDTQTASSHSEDIDTVRFTALEGGLTEHAVYSCGGSEINDRSFFADPYYFSLKPFDTETVNNGETPIPYNASSGRTYYAETTKNPRRHRFFFINSCGLLESASLLYLEEKDIKYDTATHKLYKDASFSYAPNVSASKTSSTSWKMSSGYCTKAWMEWWAGEFAFAKRFWMETGTVTDDEGNVTDYTIEPVTINAETITVYDKAKGSLGSVNFTVSSAVY